MSKINQLQASALNAPVNKIEPVKAPVKKPVATKPVVSKPVEAKTVAVKPAAAKPIVVVSKTKVTKPVKEKTPKLKMERDSFTMPKAEYAQFYVLKERLAKLGQPAKKSELLRAGIMLLTAMTDAALKTAMSKVPTIKTGRPKKK
ncbi:MAG: hypothetical protein Q8L73_04885 [Methylotenera sp.]|nr:hypothetical protein [Methylotenera sp.]